MKIGAVGAQAADITGSRTKSVEDGFKQLLDKAVASQEDKQLQEAARQLEALFIYQVFSRMRATVDKGGLFAESMAGKIFQGMYDQEVSIKAAETGSLGLAEMVYEQLRRK